MRAAVLLLTLLPTVAFAATPDHPRAACPRTGVQNATGAQPQARAQRLDQLPPANQQLTVLRTVDGCEKPVIVRYDVDGRGRAR